MLNTDKNKLARKNRKKLIVGKLEMSFPIFVFITLFTFNVQAQKSEIGAGIGGMNYTGDLIKSYRFAENRLGGIVYYRNNLSNTVSLRYAATFGTVQGSDDPPFDTFAAQRNAEFKIFLVEPSVTIEYNFLDYKDKNSIINFSPYFFAGAGFFTFFGNEPGVEEYSNFQPVIPVGIGLKYNINRNWRFNFEMGARKTFFDYLDNVSEGIPNTKNYQSGNPHDSDTYYFVGFSLSYAFYPVICPFDYN